jgi:hypothetical protein
MTKSFNDVRDRRSHRPAVSLPLFGGRPVRSAAARVHTVQQDRPGVDVIKLSFSSPLKVAR